MGPKQTFRRPREYLLAGEGRTYSEDGRMPACGHTDKFQHIAVQFEAMEIGYAAINSYTYKDVRDKGRRSHPTKTA
jgi:hypothetical protein